MSEDFGGFGGPDVELNDFYGRALNGPTLIALSLEDADALRERVIDARTIAGLTDADRALLEQGNREVNAGLSPTLQDQVGGDWAAEDAALDAEDDDESKALPPTEGWVGL